MKERQRAPWWHSSQDWPRFSEKAGIDPISMAVATRQQRKFQLRDWKHKQGLWAKDSILGINLTLIATNCKNYVKIPWTTTANQMKSNEGELNPMKSCLKVKEVSSLGAKCPPKKLVHSQDSGQAKLPSRQLRALRCLSHLLKSRTPSENWPGLSHSK